MQYRELRIQTFCLLVIAAVALGFALYWLRPVMIPFMLALLITYALAPLLAFLKRHLYAPHAIIVTIAFLIVLLLLTSLSIIVTTSINQLTSDAGSYQSQLNRLITKMIDKFPIETFGVSPEVMFAPLLGLQGGAVSGIATYVVNTLFNLLSEGLLVLIMVFFLLIGQKEHMSREQATWAEVENNIKLYISTKVLLSAVTGVLVWAILEALQVHLAIVFGLFAFLLNFIPNIGSVIATLLPIPVVILSDDVSASRAIMAILIPGSLQFLIGNVLEPKVMGTALDLHPVVVLMALIFWGTLWGLVGMILATPITAALKIWLVRSDFTRPAGELLAGRLPEKPSKIQDV